MRGALSKTPRSCTPSSLRVLVELKTVWRDGTSHFLFEPIEFLEKLAALIPLPGVNLLLSHGVLASRARWRSHVLTYGRPTPDATLTCAARPVVPTHPWPWPALMHRALGLDVLACPRCGGRLRVLATIQPPALVRAFLPHVPVAPALDLPGPAPPSPATP